MKRAWFAKEDPDTYPVKEEDPEDRLFRCSNCYVVVHQGCYPVGNISNGKLCSSGILINLKYEVSVTLDCLFTSFFLTWKVYRFLNIF